MSSPVFYCLAYFNFSHAQTITKLKKPKQGASRGSSSKHTRSTSPRMKKSTRRYGSRSYGKSSKNLKELILFNLTKKPSVLLVTIFVLISILQYRENTFSSLTKLLGRQRSMPDFTPPTSSDECKQMLLHGYWQEFFYGVLKSGWKVSFLGEGRNYV